MNPYLTDSMEAAIETRALTVEFPSPGGAIKALDSVDLRVDRGQVFGFLGPNGAGKTTTMHILLGFIAPTSGEARIFGTDVRSTIARQNIGYLQEHPDTYRFLSGRELLTLTGRLFRLDRRTLRERIDRVVADVDMTEALDRRIGTYSRGMLQRICVAQALINDPDLVILDEPTGGLDPIGRTAIRRLIASLKERGKTVFFSSHELSEVELVCDTIAILARGRVVAQGKASELVPEGEHLEKYFLSVVSDNAASERADAVARGGA